MKDADVDSTNFDDLELELRKLPGVRSAGFTDTADLLVVQVQVAGNQPSSTLPQQAARIAHRHADKPVSIEVVRWRTIEVPVPAVPTATVPVAAAETAPANTADIVPAATAEATGTEPNTDDAIEPARPRVRLLAVLTFPDTDELEVHLTCSGRRIIGRALASEGITGASKATLLGLTNFVPDLMAGVAWVEELSEHNEDAAMVVACAIEVDGIKRHGIAAGGSRIEAAARATLHAVNRRLESRGATTT